MGRWGSSPAAAAAAACPPHLCTCQASHVCPACLTHPQPARHGRRGPAKEQPAEGDQGCAARQHAHCWRRLGAAGPGLQPVCAPHLNPGAQRALEACSSSGRCCFVHVAHCHGSAALLVLSQAGEPRPLCPLHPALPFPGLTHLALPASHRSLPLRPTTSASATSGPPSARST